MPLGGPGGDDERRFLKTIRTPDKERVRLKRINDEFTRGFKGLFHVGPAVTVFGGRTVPSPLKWLLHRNHRQFSYTAVSVQMPDTLSRFP